MRYWWVSQANTFEAAVRGGYMWSPKVQQNGGIRHAYQVMTEVQPGDQIFSYSKGAIRAVGKALSSAYSSNKPIDLDRENSWNQDGWRVDVDFDVSIRDYRPSIDWEFIRPMLPTKYSPLTKNGIGAQGMYLSQISEELAFFLSGQMQRDPIVTTYMQEVAEKQDFADEMLSWGVKDYPETERREMVLSRVGQGLFRKRVLTFEKTCRVTGVGDSRFLIASHIKPWRVSEKLERLDGNNGLMLAPHIDRLFDRGFITFTAKRSMRFSRYLPDEIASRWKLDSRVDVGKFTSSQNEYLAYHADVLFESDAQDPTKARNLSD